MGRWSLLVSVYDIARHRGHEWERSVLRPFGYGTTLVFLPDHALKAIVEQWG